MEKRAERAHRGLEVTLGSAKGKGNKKERNNRRFLQEKEDKLSLPGGQKDLSPRVGADAQEVAKCGGPLWYFTESFICTLPSSSNPLVHARYHS